MNPRGLAPWRSQRIEREIEKDIEELEEEESMWLPTRETKAVIGGGLVDKVTDIYFDFEKLEGLI